MFTIMSRSYNIKEQQSITENYALLDSEPNKTNIIIYFIIIIYLFFFF